MFTRPANLMPSFKMLLLLRNRFSTKKSDYDEHRAAI